LHTAIGDVFEDKKIQADAVQKTQYEKYIIEKNSP
jgi:hypothetical protein